MTFNNRGRIRPAAGPEGHTHSIYQLTDIGASGTDGDTLVMKNGVWVSTNALPYSIAAGVYTFGALSIAAGANSGAININFANVFGINSKFSQPPIITATLGSYPGGSGALVPRIGTTSSASFNLYVINLGTTTATVTANTLVCNWQAIQMINTSASGTVSQNPNE